MGGLQCSLITVKLIIMFVNSIEKVTNFTRPIRSITRKYGSKEVMPGCATCIIVNDEGWVLTCKHVMEVFRQAESINNRYKQFMAEVAVLPAMSDSKKRRAITALEQKYGYSKSNPCPIQIKYTFDNIVDKSSSITVVECGYADLALVKFIGFNRVLCNTFPVFKDNPAELKQGLSLCRLGFPYPEFNNFQYNVQTDDIEWTNTGKANSPLFPIDGILTRHAADANGHIVGLELSTPGLKGQSGGPLFNKDGLVCGIQSSTKSLPLGFDQVNREIMVEGKKKKVSNYPFLHLGICVHVDLVKRFMDENGVKYLVG